MLWNWQQPDWQDFRYEKNCLESREARLLHSAGLISGLIKHLDPGCRRAIANRADRGRSRSDIRN
jgi:hypothetical protein